MATACTFSGRGGGPGDGDGEGPDEADASPVPGPDELQAAHVPLSGWARGTGDIVVSGAATIDTTALTVAGFTLPDGARLDGFVQAGAAALDENIRPPEIALLRAGSFRVEPGASLTVTGDRVLVVVVPGPAVVAGGIDASAAGISAGAGGASSGGLGRGGNGDTPLATNRHSGGGGGGFGTDGARGGSVDCFCIEDADGGGGGDAYGEPNQPFLHAGSSGGRADTCDARGGAGGGAVQITSETSIEHSGWIAVNGGGGEVGVTCEIGLSTIPSAGGGGGSGGAIYLEAPTVVVSGMLVANGGSGGSGFPGTAGADGQMGAIAAIGGTSAGSASQDGGDGAAVSTGAEFGGGWGSSTVGNAGGGGGGVGRITIDTDLLTSNGTVSPAPATP